jgi:hypothetical protein
MLHLINCATRRHIPEELNFHHHRCENLKSRHLKYCHSHICASHKLMYTIIVLAEEFQHDKSIQMDITHIALLQSRGLDPKQRTIQHTLPVACSELKTEHTHMYSITYMVISKLLLLMCCVSRQKKLGCGRTNEY